MREDFGKDIVSNTGFIETENQKYRQQVKENILKAIELHKRDIKKLKATLKRIKEGKHPYYEKAS